MLDKEESRKNLNLEKLATYIRELRHAQGWSTVQLSEASNLSLGFLNQLENNKMKGLPKPSSLVALAKAFKISPLKLQQLAGLIPANHYIEENNEEWQVHFKSKLSDMGLKKKYVNEIISYIETVELKQEIEDKNKKEE